jgi:hypothetical protein
MHGYRDRGRRCNTERDKDGREVTKNRNECKKREEGKRDTREGKHIKIKVVIERNK